VRWHTNRSGARRCVVALCLVLTVALTWSQPASAAHSNGAGLVIRHGDGTIIYAYVEFDEDSITSDELLFRSGLDVIVSVYGGLGTGVCTIDGEGCPADDCYCKSYSNPAYFWHFYTAQGGGWREEIRGASSRVVADGDVDGWSWTASDPALPVVSIDDIAAMNGVDRNAQDPTPTPEPPTPTPVPPTATSAPTDTPAPTSTPTPPPELPTPTATQQIAAAPTVTSTPTHSPELAPTAPAMPTVTASATATSQTPTQTALPAGTATATPTSLPTITPSPGTTTRAVAISPDGTATTLEVNNTDDGSGSRSLLIFGSMAGIVVVVGGFVMLRKRGIV
jgi:hypothetical protein